MDNTMILFLTGAGFALSYALVWRFRKKDGGPLFGYTSSWVAMAPIAVGIGILMMLASAFVWLTDPNSP
jgi:hypothetical protein